MKVTSERQFSPVTVTLDTQDEVNKMFALLNFAPVQLALNWVHLKEVLLPYRTLEYHKYHESISRAARMHNP